MAEQADKDAMSERVDNDAVPEQADHNVLLQQANIATVPNPPKNDTASEKDALPKQNLPDNLLWLGTVGLDSQGRRSLAYLDKDTNQQTTWSDLTQDIEDPQMRKLFRMLDEEVCEWIGDDSSWPRPVQAMLQCLRFPIYLVRVAFRASFLNEPVSWGGVMMTVVRMPAMIFSTVYETSREVWRRRRAHWRRECECYGEAGGVRAPLLKDEESYGTSGEVRLGDEEKGLPRHASA